MDFIRSPRAMTTLAGGIGGAALGLTLEYVVIKPMSKGNQDWVAPVTYTILGMGIAFWASGRGA